MIDLHTHILPNMDDGAQSREEAYALISMLKAQGITRIVLTPHFYPQREKLSDFLRRRDISFRSISDCDMDLILGSEAYLAEPLLSLDSIEDLCIGKSSYLLLELPYSDKWSQGVYRQIDHLIAKFNICPIIAHAERYEAVKEHTEEIFQRLVDIGCLLQFNTESVINKKTRPETLKLIREGWVDLIGSDCHNLDARAPEFDLFTEIVRKRLGVPYLNRLIEDRLHFLT